MNITVVKRKLKHLVPQWLWHRLRSVLIRRKHRLCTNKLRGVINKIDVGLLQEIKPLKNLPDGKKIIWQYWAQGFEESSMPPLVNICLQSVDKHTRDFALIRISDKNINEYIELPLWLTEKQMSKSHFSDLLRCLLFSKYGGLWLDAATFLTGDIPEFIYNSDCFMYSRDDAEKGKKYWERTFAYYWGWSHNFFVRTLIGIMYAEKGNKTICDLASLLLTFWKHNTVVPDYFVFQILIEMYFRRNPEERPAIVSDTIPHLLRQYLTGYPVPGYSLTGILKETTVHSLNYKNEVIYSNLRAVFPEYRILNTVELTK